MYQHIPKLPGQLTTIDTVGLPVYNKYMANFDNVKVASDKSSYSTGDKITLRVSGKAVDQFASSISLLLTADDGSTKTIPVSPDIVVAGVSVPYKITSVTDSSGRTYKISEDGQSAEATA